MCIILSNVLKFARESGADGEGKLARRRNKKNGVFTHFLTQKSTHLSRQSSKDHAIVVVIDRDGEVTFEKELCSSSSYF